MIHGVLAPAAIRWDEPAVGNTDSELRKLTQRMAMGCGGIRAQLVAEIRFRVAKSRRFGASATVAGS